MHNCGPFGKNDLVYGPSAGGKLRAWQQQNGGKMLNDFDKPTEITDWFEFSRMKMDEALKNGNTIHFDLTHMDNVEGVLAGTFKPKATTSQELRYLRDNWNAFGGNVKFYQDGKLVKAPWEK